MKKLKKFFRYDNIGYFFVLPAVIYMLFFVGYPIVSNFILSFQDVTVKTLSSPNKPFAGIENYQTLFQDEVLRTSIIKHSAVYGAVPGIPVYDRFSAGLVL